PWAEAGWFERFRSLNKQSTAILITHRLSIAMRADLILVLHEGQLVEAGTHDELLGQGGRYAASWLAQQSAQANLAVELRLSHAVPS
nr:hypothetical protein [Chloroflexaceae bacterium]